MPAIWLAVCIATASGHLLIDLHPEAVAKGRTFDGVGGLSGGGATSKLLPSYPAEQRAQILDLLFKPQFGASLDILKVEIGGDGDSTEGSESSHEHVQGEISCNRGYEWFVMKEAKMRNPEIRLYGLSWSFPNYLAGATGNPLDNPNTPTYIADWIACAKNAHNLTIDFIGYGAPIWSREDRALNTLPLSWRSDLVCGTKWTNSLHLQVLHTSSRSGKSWMVEDFNQLE
eukprot:m.309082 g.309082  ORF g.309082 m.309082 type:complete len:229 (-) comp16369_c0_seq59:7333-8019(-)